MATQNLGRVVGFSAYEIAVQEGFIGTEAEWLVSIKQPALDAAEMANTATNNANTATSQANTARDSANTAATAANTAKTNADTATSAANTATTNANNAATTANNAKGWTPKHTLEADGADRQVWKLTSYIGGTGTAPTANLNEYLKDDNTYTTTKSLAANAKGNIGPIGISTTDMTTAGTILGLNTADSVPQPPKQLSVVGASIVANVFTINYQNAVTAYNAASGVDTPLTNAMSPVQMFQNLQKQMDARILNTGLSTNLILGNGTYQAVSDFVLATQKGAANGVVPLNASTLIDQVYLPSYVDDIIEGYKSGANFYKEVGLTTLITGETGKIYIDLTSGQKDKQYRWSGSAYIQITNGLIASTNDVPEGTNLYFTVARVLETVLTGFSSGSGTVAATDTILQAINKIIGNIALKANIDSQAFTGNPTAPTQTVGDNTTKLATTEFVKTAVEASISGDEIGDIKITNRTLGSSYLLADGSTYLQSSYPTLYALIGLLPYGLTDTWSAVTSGFGTTAIRAIGFGNGVWIAVGASGTMTRSTNDGATWSAVTNGFGAVAITGVYYGNGVWIAVCANGAMARSTDNGATWSGVASGFGATPINGVHYGNGVWIAVGDGGKMSRSTNDGATWSAVTSGFSSTAIYGVGYGNGVWLAVGNSGVITKSTNDGATWSSVTSGIGGAIVSVGYGNGVWIAGGNSGAMARSTNDGTTWSTVTSGFGSSQITAVGYSNKIWVGTGSAGKISRSLDFGITWEAVTNNFAGNDVNSIGYGNGAWIAGGGSGKMDRSTYNYDSSTLFKVPTVSNLLYTKAYIKATT